MSLRQPITQARWQQQIFIRVVRTVAFAHRTLWDHPVSDRQQKLCCDIDFSDGPLAVGLVLGTFPVYGCPTLLCVLASLVLRVNLPALQVVNQLTLPLQIAMLMPLAR